MLGLLLSGTFLRSLKVLGMQSLIVALRCLYLTHFIASALLLMHDVLQACS